MSRTRTLPYNSSLRRFGTLLPSGRGVTIGALSQAHRDGRTIFPSRVFAPDEVKRVLKTGQQSRKIGKTVMKGHRRGWPIFTLTLEERATCPRSCGAWGFCYGNNMQAAERIEAGPALEAALWDELAVLQAAHPGDYLVRIHVLGDFYSAAYVTLWGNALIAFPALHVFGFTARDPHDPIGVAIDALVRKHWDRFAVRFSGRPGRSFASRIAPEDGAEDPLAITCPAQTGATDCCATCALCWQSDRSISFRRH